VTVVFIFKAGHRALIISAHEMDKKEGKQYGRKIDLIPEEMTNSRSLRVLGYASCC
jgi:hypothetical protein